MNRREFLRKSAIAGTLISTSTGSTFSWQGNKKPKHVIILGAGFAGLAAGLKLTKAGIKVTILEARRRTGGRVFSFRPQQSDEQVIELGAEWVGASHNRIIELCHEFNLTLEDNRFETDLLREGVHTKAGNWAFGKEMETFWRDKVKIWEAMSEKEKSRLDKLDWWRFLSNQGIPYEDLFKRDLIDSTDFGESIRHTSAYAAFAEYAESSEKNEMDFKIKGGNTKLIEAMASTIGNSNILLDHKVVSVNQQQKNNIMVSCANGIKLEGDYLICTLPTKAMYDVIWSPGLPKETIEAIQSLQYSRIGKFPLVFSEKFWERDDFDMITDTPAHYFYHGTKNQSSNTGVLMCYATGDKADVLSAVSQKQRLDIITDALYPAFGDVRKFLKEDLLYYWGRDEYSFGAYAFYGKNQWFEVMPVLQKPFRKVLFAGEHLADWQGFMEGAINSGEAAASALM